MRAILSVALAVAFVAGVSAQDKPNFAGTWKIDPERSDKNCAGAGRETITVEGSKMTVSRTAAGNTVSAVHRLDGTPSKNTVAGPQGGAPVEHVYTSKWEGNVLVTTIEVPTHTVSQKRSIEADGTMKFDVTAVIRGERVACSMVFNKTQDKPNFVGTWKIDPARSDQYSGGAPPETISVEGSKMTVSRTRAGNTDSTVYMLDGTPSKNTTGPAGRQAEMILNSKWEGNVLVTTVVSPMVTRIEKRSIEADGTMKNEVTFNFKDGRTETGWMVFSKTK